MLTEVTLFGDHGILPYAGTVDAVLLIDDERWMVDFKTSKDIYPEAALQLAALNACEIAIIEGKEEDFDPCDRLAVVRIGKDGEFDVKEVYEESACLEAFEAALELWTWKHDVNPYKETEG